jgi:hypothetical protein
MKLEREVERLLAFADLIGITYKTKTTVEELLEGYRRALERVEKIKELKEEDVKAIRLVEAEDNVVLWIYTEEVEEHLAFGVALNLVDPDLSEWGYLPHYRNVPKFAKITRAN